MAVGRKGLKLAMETPANYRIRVQGFLLHRFLERLGDIRVQTTSSRDEAPVTTLEGKVRDQAELVGLMKSLYDLHLPIMSVDLLNFK
jgi:hypothetical protein